MIGVPSLEIIFWIILSESSGMSVILKIFRQLDVIVRVPRKARIGTCHYKVFSTSFRYFGKDPNAGSSKHRRPRQCHVFMLWEVVWSRQCEPE
jgi:hypothetical protein